MGKLVTIAGVAIRPGVSRNQRQYTRENIGRLVERAGARIRDGSSPITMRTHHGAGDDSTRIVGRVTRIWQDESGAARYEGEIADAGHGPTTAGLLPTSENDTSAALRGVSIRGRWAFPPRRTTAEDGTEVETADDLEIDGLDFTASPGVAGARRGGLRPGGAERAARTAELREVLGEHGRARHRRGRPGRRDH